MVVKGVHPDSCQGDIRFLDILVQMGCIREDTPEGIKISAPFESTYLFIVEVKLLQLQNLKS